MQSQEATALYLLMPRQFSSAAMEAVATTWGPIGWTEASHVGGLGWAGAKTATVDIPAGGVSATLVVCTCLSSAVAREVVCVTCDDQCCNECLLTGLHVALNITAQSVEFFVGVLAQCVGIRRLNAQRCLERCHCLVQGHSSSIVPLHLIIVLVIGIVAKASGFAERMKVMVVPSSHFICK